MADQTCFGHVLQVFFFVLTVLHASEGQIYYRQYQTIDDCKVGPTDNPHQFYDISQLRCTDCAQGTDKQTVDSTGKRTWEIFK